MDNPWLKISHSDYENHMTEVGQARVLNRLTMYYLDKYKPESFALIGCSTGNGLEHIKPEITKNVYAIDINPNYLNKTRERFNKKVQTKVPLKLKCPNLRHKPCFTKGKDRSKKENTMLEPGKNYDVDFEALRTGNYDTVDIRAGKGYKVGDNVWGSHDGTFYPVSGNGFTNLDRVEHKLLKKLNGTDYEKVMNWAKNHPFLDTEKINKVKNYGKNANNLFNKIFIYQNYRKRLN